MTPHRMIAASLALALLCTATGCPKKTPPPVAPTPGPLPSTGKDLGGKLGPPPLSGSTTLPGSIRDLAARDQVLNDLRNMGLLFKQLEIENMSPATVADWTAHRELPARCRQWLTSGELLFYPSVKVANLSAGSSQTIIAYFKHAPTAGGPVLFADGSARALSAAEFNAAPKAGK